MCNVNGCAASLFWLIRLNVGMFRFSLSLSLSSSLEYYSFYFTVVVEVCFVLFWSTRKVLADIHGVVAIAPSRLL